MERDEAWVVNVEGRCMEPAIRPGDSVVAWRDAPWRVGDVALIRTPRGLVVHRLLGCVRSPGRTRWIHGGDRGRSVGLARPEDLLARVDAPGQRRRRAILLLARLAELWAPPAWTWPLAQRALRLAARL